MSRSYKTEPARKAERQRRDARRSKRNENDSHLEHLVDARPAYPRRWTPLERA